MEIEKHEGYRNQFLITLDDEELKDLENFSSDWSQTPIETIKNAITALLL